MASCYGLFETGADAPSPEIPVATAEPSKSSRKAQVGRRASPKE
jgi:hypothetical protein